MADIIDFRSDTVTKPTEEMRRAMMDAEVGDDVYGEDPTVRRLEEVAAELLGKEAGLFVTSGTQGNQVAIAVHAHSGEEVIAEADSHIFYYEAAAVSAIAGAQIRQIPGAKGVMEPLSVQRAMRDPNNVHYPRTALISVEDTHNRAGGTVVPLDNLRALRSIADAYNVPIHIDGARLFNAAVATGVAARDIASHADTVQICLSKGLCAPIGSVLVGSKSFIDRARQWRKRLGGGLRQAGVIAAPGIIALTKMVDRLAEDHANARYLADSLSNIRGLRVDIETVQTNIVIVDVAEAGPTSAQFLGLLHGEGVLATAFGETTLRFVTHRDVTREQTTAAVERIAGLLASAVR